MNYTLPMSPSVNAMYRRSPGTYGMYKTMEAKKWIKECLKIIDNVIPLVGEVGVDIDFFFKRECDLDNRLKSLIDVIQEAGIIENDSQVYRIVAKKAFDRENPRIEVSIVKI